MTLPYNCTVIFFKFYEHSYRNYIEYLQEGGHWYWNARNILKQRWLSEEYCVYIDVWAAVLDFSILRAIVGQRYMISVKAAQWQTNVNEYRYTYHLHTNIHIKQFSK